MNTLFVGLLVLAAILIPAIATTTGLIMGVGVILLYLAGKDNPIATLFNAIDNRLAFLIRKLSRKV